MRTIERAIIVPGFTVNEASAGPFASALRKGEYIPAVKHLDILPVGDLLADPAQYKEDLLNSLVFAQSMGVMAVEQARGIVVLSGPERNTLLQTLKGAHGTSSADNSGAEDGIMPQTLRETAEEFWRNRRANLRGSLDIGNFSSAEHLVNGADNFPELRLMFQFDGDEFGYTREPSVSFARRHGIHADILHGKHNEAFSRPENTLRQIGASLTAAGLQRID